MKPENKLLKDIKRGRYRGEYLIYCRKSTDDFENQRNSLDHQRKETRCFARRSRLSVAAISIEGFCTQGVVSESHSGFAEDNDLTFTKSGEIKYKICRPKFNRLVQFLNHGYFAGIICVSWDRLSRNKSDNAIITKLIRTGIDVQFATATYDDTSAGALHMDIDGMFAQHHSRVTKEKVTNAMHKMRDEGIVVYMAPLGYVNTGRKYQDVRSTSHKPFDPVRAPIVKVLFEKYATGDWSMSDLAHWANDQGLTNFPKRRPRTKAELLSEEPIQIEKIAKPITLNNIHYILGNPFYTGLMQNSQGEWIPSRSHEALIDTELFDRVQKIKGRKQVSVRYKNPVGHALRGFVRCAGCQRVYTPYAKKGFQYFGSRCAPNCINTRRSCNLQFLESALGERLLDLFLEPHELEAFDRKTDVARAGLEEKLNQEREQSLRRQKKLNEDLSYLRANRLDLLRSKVYSPDGYVEEERRLLSELAEAESDDSISSEALHQTIKDAIKLSEYLKDLATHYKTATSPEREEIMRCLFSELTMSESTFDCSLKPEFNAMKKEGVWSSAPDIWLSELMRNRDSIRRGLARLEDSAAK